MTQPSTRKRPTLCLWELEGPSAIYNNPVAVRLGNRLWQAVAAALPVGVFNALPNPAPNPPPPPAPNPPVGGVSPGVVVGVVGMVTPWTSRQFR